MKTDANSALGPELALIAGRLAAYTVSEGRRARLGDEHFDLSMVLETPTRPPRHGARGPKPTRRLFGRWGHPSDLVGTQA